MMPEPLHTATIHGATLYLFRNRAEAVSFLASLREREAVIEEIADPAGNESLSVYQVRVRLPADDGVFREL